MGRADTCSFSIFPILKVADREILQSFDSAISWSVRQEIWLIIWQLGNVKDILRSTRIQLNSDHSSYF